MPTKEIKVKVEVNKNKYLPSFFSSHLTMIVTEHNPKKANNPKKIRNMVSMSILPFL